MNIFDAIKRRCSVRRYLPKVVPDDMLLRLCEAAQQAPSASNRQEGRFVFVRDRKTKKLLCEAAKKQKFVEEAAVVIICCAETNNHVMTCGQLCYPIDLAIAIDHMSLAAVELGLGTCWVGAFFEDKVKDIVGIPDHIRVVELLALGYPFQKSISPKNRLPLSKIMFFEKWGSSR